MDISFKGNPLWIVAATLVLALAIYLPIRKNAADKAKTQIESAIIIERIENVIKVVSVEAHFSEMLSYNKVLYDLPGFRKKAIVQVKGKVLVGYDMEGLDLQYDLKKKTLNISNLPEAEILAIDADAEYFDLEQGIFYKFTKEEMTSISKLSKDLIRDKALKSDIIAQAERQKSEMLAALLDPLIEMGWKVRIEGKDIESKNIKPKTD
jgi:hypothetical protein